MSSRFFHLGLGSLVLVASLGCGPRGASPSAAPAASPPKPASSPKPATSHNFEAVVIAYQSSAMVDHLDDGGFSSFDAIHLSIKKPDRVSGGVIRVFVSAGELKADSPFRQVGSTCQFSLEADNLDMDVLFLGALEDVRLKPSNQDSLVERQSPAASQRALPKPRGEHGSVAADK